ncbi:GLPGLI family protein [Chryseobacterium soli]|uniref:GLPGLI family protein n=1 Tax=Chryseobacterium soli TaxID=445961 RepID=UPI00068B569B|nr:GLPGLI family protein [Chryseobacterium soli]
MKFHITLFISIFPLLIFAQNYRFTYEYKFKPQKEKMDSVITDYMNLDTDGKKSLFFNDSKHKMDSVYATSKNLNELTQYKNYNQNVSYTIFKDYSIPKINFYSKKFNLDILIEEKELPKWNLIDEFSVINTFKCQKAYTKYKGREWYAWFTKDIPINDGPYKFIGLPGLIIRVSDKEESHTFDLVQVIHIKDPFLEVPKKVRLMTQTQFDELAKKNINHKTDVAFTNVTNKTVTVGLNDGNMMNLSNNTSNVDQAIIDKFRKSNNPIELKSSE